MMTKLLRVRSSVCLQKQFLFQTRSSNSDITHITESISRHLALNFNFATKMYRLGPFWRNKNYVTQEIIVEHNFLDKQFSDF